MTASVYSQKASNSRRLPKTPIFGFGSTRSQVRILSPRLTFQGLSFWAGPQKGPQPTPLIASGVPRGPASAAVVASSLPVRRVSALVQKGGAEVDQLVKVEGHGGDQLGTC